MADEAQVVFDPPGYIWVDEIHAVHQDNLLQLVKITKHVSEAQRFQRLSKLLRNEAERQCNFAMSDKELNKSNSEIARWLKSATELAANYGYLVYHQPDPRGWALWLYKADDLGDREIDSCYSTVGIGVCSL